MWFGGTVERRCNVAVVQVASLTGAPTTRGGSVLQARRVRRGTLPHALVRIVITQIADSRWSSRTLNCAADRITESRGALATWMETAEVPHARPGEWQ